MSFDYDLRPVKTKKHLLSYLGMEEFFFDVFVGFDSKKIEWESDGVIEINKEEINTLSFSPYWKHKIPKKNVSRGYRVVWELIAPYDQVHKSLSRKLYNFFQLTFDEFPHRTCFGYAKGRGIRDNAFVHIGKKNALKCDIRNFFGTITRQRVESFFCEICVPLETSNRISYFTTIDNSLALGLPSSPVIANAICYLMDQRLCKLAEQKGCFYSRYADDMTFSSDGDLPEISDVEYIVSACGFSLATEKTRVTKRGQNHYVTGLSITDANAPHAPRKMKRKLRQELYFSSKYGLRGHLSNLAVIDDHEVQRYINRLDGMVKYVAFHEPRKARFLSSQWENILFESGDSVSFSPGDNVEGHFDIYLDETEFEIGSKKYLALGLSASKCQGALDECTKKILQEHLADPWADGKKHQLRKTGLHYADSTEDLRKKYIESLQLLPFDGYIVFGEMNRFQDYEEKYLKLLGDIIRRRLMSVDRCGVLLSVEQNSKVSLSKIDLVVQNEFDKLIYEDNRRPCSVNVRKVSKKEYGVSVPDFLLGAFRNYIQAGEVTNPPTREHILFERLRDKIRLIVDADTKQEFSRRNPI